MKFIRRVVPLFSLLAFSLIQPGCSRQSVHKKSFLSPVRIRVSYAATKNPATVAFIHSSEAIINIVSDEIETIALEEENILNKDPKDLSLLDKMKLAKLKLELLSTGNSLIEEMDKIQEYVTKKEKEGVSRNDLKAYEAVEKAIEKRINQLNKKYSKLMN